MVASTVVAQMLPDGVVKGGTAMLLRLGYQESRFSRDLDAARNADAEEYEAAFRASLAEGWGGFIGDLRPDRRPDLWGYPSST